MQKKEKDNYTKNKINGTVLDKFNNYTFYHLLIIIILPIIIYYKSVGFEFVVIDDKLIIKNNFDIIENIKNIDIVFQRDAFLSKTGNSFYRPIQTVSFMFDAMISKENPWMYHLSSIIIHILTAVSLYFFLKFLDFKGITAFLFSLLFAVHPLFASDVSWVTARGDLLIGLYGIWLFISFGKYFITDKSIYFILHSLIFILAVFTKETIILFPVLLVFYYIFILRASIKGAESNQQIISKENRSRLAGRKINKYPKNGQAGKIKYKKLFPYFISWIAIFLLYFFIRSKVMHLKLTEEIFGIIPFIQNLPVIPTVIGKFFIPIHLSTMPVYETSFTIIGTILLMAIVFTVIKYSKEKKWLVLLGFMWFLLLTFPPMFYRIEQADYIITYFEHRTYLPLIGLIIILSTIFQNNIIKISINLFTALSIIVFLVLIFLAYEHCNDYKDSITFFNSTLKYNPNNVLAYTNLGLIYTDMQKYNDAALAYDKAIEICSYPSAYFNRGTLEKMRGNDSLAEKDYIQTITLDPTFMKAYFGLAQEREQHNDHFQSLQYLKKAEQLDPENESIYFCEGDIFEKIKNFNEALNYYTKAISLNPDYFEAYKSRARLKFIIKDYNGSIEDTKQVLRLRPNIALAYSNIGMAYCELGELNNAIKYFDTSLQLNKNYAPVIFNRGNAKQKNNDFTGACEDWNEALRLGYNPAKDMIDKYCK
jgi:tetratricopeptide (TPR) repeat protein